MEKAIALGRQKVEHRAVLHGAQFTDIGPWRLTVLESPGSGPHGALYPPPHGRRWEPPFRGVRRSGWDIGPPRFVELYRKRFVDSVSAVHKIARVFLSKAKSGGEVLYQDHRDPSTETPIGQDRQGRPLSARGVPRSVQTTARPAVFALGTSWIVGPGLGATPLVWDGRRWSSSSATSWKEPVPLGVLTAQPDFVSLGDWPWWETFNYRPTPWMHPDQVIEKLARVLEEVGPHVNLVDLLEEPEAFLRMADALASRPDPR